MKKIVITIPDDAEDICISLASTPDDVFVVCPRNIPSGHTKRVVLRGHFFYPQLTFMQRRAVRKRIKKAYKMVLRTNDNFETEYPNKPIEK